MEFDFKLDKVIEIFDLVKKLSWGAIPLWFSLTLPVIYIAYKKLLPDQNAAAALQPESFWQRVKRLVSLPQMDNIVIYCSLAMFVVGTITLYIDQNQKERTRNNGLRIKEYLLLENRYSVPKNDLVGTIRGLKLKNVDQVLNLFPGEFIEVENSTVILMDSVILKKVLCTSEKLLDSYLADSSIHSPISSDTLFSKCMYFTRPVIYKLITDSSHKFSLHIFENNRSGIVKK